MKRHFCFEESRLHVLRKKNNRMMLNVIYGGRLLVCQVLELNQIQRPYVLAAAAWAFLNNLLHKVL